jgi:hypothetical protein
MAARQSEEEKRKLLVTQFRQSSELSDQHHEYVSRLVQFTNRAIPLRLQSDQSTVQDSPASGVLPLEGDIENIQQFYTWFDLLQEQAGSQEDERFRYESEI